MDLPEQPVSLGGGRFRASPLLGHLMHTGGGQGDRRMPGEQLQQLRVVRSEDAEIVPAEHDARTNHAAAPLQWHANDTTQCGTLVCRQMAAGYFVVAGEPHRLAARHHGSGHPFGEREDSSGLAGNADVGLFAVGAGCLIDAADRARATAEQLSAAPQNSFQQGAERELTGQILRHRDQPRCACGDALLGLR